MKKLGVLIVTLLTAIMAFSFSAFADESPVNVSTTVAIEDTGKGYLATSYTFSKEFYDFDCGLDTTLKKEITNIHKSSGLAKYTEFNIIDVEGQETVNLEFIFYFNSIDELNNKIHQIDQAIYGSDTRVDSSIKYENGQANLSLSGYTLSILETCTSLLIFSDLEVHNHGCKSSYNLEFYNGEDLMCKEINADNAEFSTIFNFSVKSNLGNAATVAPTAAPSTAKPAATKKATTTKTSSKKDNSPKTGDSNNFILLVSLMAVSVVSMGVVGYKKFRKN